MRRSRLMTLGCRRTRSTRKPRTDNPPGYPAGRHDACFERVRHNPADRRVRLNRAPHVCAFPVGRGTDGGSLSDRHSDPIRSAPPGQHWPLRTSVQRGPGLYRLNRPAQMTDHFRGDAGRGRSNRSRMVQYPASPSRPIRSTLVTSTVPSGRHICWATWKLFN